MSTDGPLRGLSIVALQAIGPVPLACSLLADLGAHVMTIRRPGGGDNLPAGLGVASAAPGDVIEIDLKTPPGVDAARRIISGADVLIEGFRPGTMERLGLGPDDVLASSPHLIYARVTGWGQGGPYRGMAGHDINYIGLTGALDAIGPESQPMPPLNLVGDYGGGSMFAIAGILAAVIDRHTSGTGRVVDVAMVDGAAALLGPIRALATAGLWEENRGGNLLDGGAPFYRTYRTSDERFMAVGALEPAFYSEFVAGLGLVEAMLPSRSDPKNWPALAGEFSSRFASRTRQEWTEVFDGTDACVTPVLTMSEVGGHPHNRERGALIDRGGFERPGVAPRFAPPSRPAPRQRKNARQILQASGFATAEVDSLLETGAVRDG